VSSMQPRRTSSPTPRRRTPRKTSPRPLTAGRLVGPTTTAPPWSIAKDRKTDRAWASARRRVRAPPTQNATGEFAVRCRRCPRARAFRRAIARVDATATASALPPTNARRTVTASHARARSVPHTCNARAVAARARRVNPTSTARKATASRDPARDRWAPAPRDVASNRLTSRVATAPPRTP